MKNAGRRQPDNNYNYYNNYNQEILRSTQNDGSTTRQREAENPTTITATTTITTTITPQLDKRISRI